MIKFSLSCDCDAVFDGWFKNADACDRQLEMRSICCPCCGGKGVTKSLQVPYIGNRAGKDRGSRPEIGRPETGRPETGRPEIGRDASGRAVDIDSASLPQSGKASGAMSSQSLEMFGKVYQIARQIRSHVESTCVDVGSEFAEEARKIYYGESEKRGIFGKVSRQEAKELIDEGIEVMPLPDLPELDA